MPSLLFWTYKKLALFQPPQLPKQHARHSQTAGPWRTDRACGQRLPLPNVAFWTNKKTSSLPAIPVTKAHKQCLRQCQTAGPWRTNRACGQRLPVPNVASWTYKKITCLPAAAGHKRRARHSEIAGPWRRNWACGHMPPVPNVAFWAYKKTPAAAGHKPRARQRNGGTGPAGTWPQCLTLLSEPTRKLALFHWPRLTNGAPATAKQQSLEGGTDKKTSFLPAIPATKAHKRRARHSNFGQRPPLPNVAFWTDKKTSSLPPAKTHKRCAPTIIETDAFGNFLARFLLLLRLPNKNGPRTAKHRGSEGRGRPKKASKECLTSLLKPL